MPTDAANLFDLSSKVALVTGSSRGIGLAMVKRLAQHGANVIVSSRKAPACEAAAAAINEKRPGAALAVPANVADKNELRRLVDTSCGAFGKIDILICNAGANYHNGPLGTISDEQFRRILDVNLLSNHWLIDMVAPAMATRRDGAIIIVSSIGGLLGSQSLGAYTISKAASMQLARNMAVEYGARNIRVNCIAPGLVRTDMAKMIWDDPDMLRATLTGTPLARIGEPDDIAGAAVFLSSAAGSYVTGQTIIVDGGTTSTMGVI